MAQSRKHLTIIIATLPRGVTILAGHKHSVLKVDTISPVGVRPTYSLRCQEVYDHLDYSDFSLFLLQIGLEP